MTWPGLWMGRRRFPVAVAGLACGVALALLARPLFLPQASAEQPPLLSEAEAVALAIEEAQWSGLQQGMPTALATRQMALSEYARLTGGNVPPSAARVGLDLRMPVWVVAMRGLVDWNRPGGPGTFDNITVALNARTGETVMVQAFNPGVPLPIPVPS